MWGFRRFEIPVASVPWYRRGTKEPRFSVHRSAPAPRARREREALGSSAETITGQSSTVEQLSGEHIAALILIAAAAALALVPAHRPHATWLVPLSRVFA